MFDLVRNNKRIVQLILAIITVPFALWGIDSYIRYAREDNAVATVGDYKITAAEFQQALREQQDRLRPQLGGIEPSLLESPELKRATLDELIDRHLLLRHALDARLFVGDTQLAGFIASQPSLMEDGKFSRSRYEALVAAQGLSIEAFEARLRQDLMRQQALLAVGNGVTGKRPLEHWLAAQLEAREVREAFFPADRFSGKKPDAEAVRQYYEAHRQEFEKPEEVRVEYVVLAQDRLAEGINVPEDEIKAFYERNTARYKKGEERRASHILIRVAENASAADIEAAKKKAEALRQQLLAKPGEFARLAEEHSQDPGSAKNGGDLGFFGRGMMVKPFEDAVFALKQGEISPVVKSDFGFHVIQLTDVRPERVRPLEEVRSEIIAELKRQAAQKQFAEAAEGFANVVYEQADSLRPAAEKYGLPIETSDWISLKGPGEGVLAHAKVREAIFAADSLRNRRNTEAIDVGGNRLVAARVIDHRPARIEPLEAVSGVIERILFRESQYAEAVAAGEAALAKLQKNEPVAVDWHAPRIVRRVFAPNLDEEAKQAIFAASVGVLPAYVGAKSKGGYAIYRIESVKPYDPAAEETAAAATALRQRYAQAMAQEEVRAWLAALRDEYRVTINAAALEKR